MYKGLSWKHTFTEKQQSFKYIGGAIGLCMGLNIAYNFFYEPYCNINSDIYKDDPVTRSARIERMRSELRELMKK